MFTTHIRYLIPLLLSLLLSSVLYGKDFVREYTYKAGDNDSKNSSRTIALKEVQIELLQEIGIHIQSRLKHSKYQDKGGKIRPEFAKHSEQITAGITKTQILQERWNGESFYIKVKITLDERDLDKQIKKLLQNDQLLKDLKNSQDKATKALQQSGQLKKKIAQLEKALSQEKNRAKKRDLERKRDKELTRYTQAVETISASEYFDKGLQARKDGDNELAIVYFTKAIAIDPNFAYAFYNRGYAYEKKKQYDRAI